MLIVLLLALWAIMLFAPETPAGRALHRMTVEAPARWLSRVTRGHLLLAATLAVGTIVIMWAMQGDGVVMLGFASPDILMLLTAIDASTLIDIAVVAIATAGAVRVRGIVAWLTRHVPARHPRIRAPRVRRSRPSANDDEDRPALAA